jgi:hypothetical protein
LILDHGCFESAPVKLLLLNSDQSDKNKLLLSRFSSFNGLHFVFQKLVLGYQLMLLEIGILSLGVEDSLGAQEVHPMGVAPEL